MIESVSKKIISWKYGLKTKMFRRQRYFKNALPEYSTTAQNERNCDFVPDLIKSYVQQIEEKFKPAPHNADGGLYVGVPGVAFMFLRMARSEFFQDQREELLKKASIYIKVGIDEASRVPRTSGDGIGASFLLGHAGVFGLASVIYHELGDADNESRFVRKFLEMGQLLQPNQTLLRHGANELFVGRAGYLCMAKWMQKNLGKNIVPPNFTEVLFNTIVIEGRSYSHQHRSKSPLMYSYYGTEYLGAAHGLSAIIQTLLCYPAFFDGKSEIETDLKNATDFILRCKMDNGNYPPDVGEQRGKGDELVHWCHGAPGVVYLMAKAYTQWSDEKYLKAAFECGDVVWKKGLLTKGPGICHGVGGNGYVFLLLYRLTNDEKHLHRAVQFAKFLTTKDFSRGARTPDAPHSLYEGLAGTVCFLLDLLQPGHAEFPFFDVL